MILVSLIIFLSIFLKSTNATTQTLESIWKVSQPYYVGQNEYYQFRPSLAQIDFLPLQSALQKVLIKLKIEVYNPDDQYINFNLIMLPPPNTTNIQQMNQSQSFNLYKCYLRAHDQNIKGKQCPIIGQQDSSLLYDTNYSIPLTSNKTYFFPNLKSTFSFTLEYIFTKGRNDTHKYNPYFLMYVDNTKIFTDSTGVSFNLKLYYQLILVKTFSYIDTVLYTLFGVFSLIILFATTVAIYLLLEIKKVNKNIQQLKSTKIFNQSTVKTKQQ